MIRAYFLQVPVSPLQSNVGLSVPALLLHGSAPPVFFIYFFHTIQDTKIYMANLDKSGQCW